MFRTILRQTLLFAALALPLVFAARARGQVDDREAQVKISLSREDPDVQVGDTGTDNQVNLYVFIDGVQARGAEFGLTIDGAEFVSYMLGTENGWFLVPMTNPYPGTIAQVMYGAGCMDPPIFFGKLTVAPDEPGGQFVVDVMPSLRASAAMTTDCDNKPIHRMRAFPATVNGGDPVESHRVIGDNATNEPMGDEPELGEARAPEETINDGSHDDRRDQYADEDDR